MTGLEVFEQRDQLLADDTATAPDPYQRAAAVRAMFERSSR